MQKTIRQDCLSLVLLFSCSICAQAQHTDSAYIKTINERAEKIVKKVGIPNQSKSGKVQHIVAQQYFDLNDIDTRRDTEIKTLKSENLGKTILQDSIKAIRSRADEQTAALHTAYLAKLQSVLTPAQVDAVKDGMTYGVLKLTYNAYLQMLPNLTQEQKIGSASCRERV